MSTEIALRRPPVVTFSGGPRRYEADRAGAPRFQVAYRVPRNTMDERYSQCTDHRVACDCREAELAEEIGELRHEWKALREAAVRALAGHQYDYPLGLSDVERIGFPLCLCSGCVMLRDHGGALPWSAVDYRTGRVKPAEGSLAMGWAPGEVPF